MTTKPAEPEIMPVKSFDELLVRNYQARCNAVEQDHTPRRVTVNTAWLEMVCKQADVPYPDGRLLPGSASPTDEEVAAHFANWARRRENDLANAIPVPVQ